MRPVLRGGNGARVELPEADGLDTRLHCGMIRLICVDVDGTMVGSTGVVSPAVWPAARMAREQGIRLVLCSGRPAFGRSREYAEQLDRAGWHVFQNGASVVNLANGETRSHAFSDGTVDWLIETAHRTGRVLELYSDTDYAVECDTPRARAHAQLLGVPFTARDLRSLAGPIVRAQWLANHAESDVILSEPSQGLSMSASRSPVMPDTSFVNVTLAGVDKGSAVSAVAVIYAIPLAQIMMVGDGSNDLSVLRVVGVPVAMGNAEPEVKAAARHVVADVDSGGLVEALTMALTPQWAGR